MAFPSRLSVIHETLEDVVRRLDGLPPSTAVEDLRAKAAAFQASASGAGDAEVHGEDRERFMKEVIALHFAVTKLEKQAK